MHKSRLSVPLQLPQLGVPRIIMQTWKTSDIPAKWSQSPESIRKLMPDWQYVLMTDADNEQFVRDNYPDFLATYLAFPHAIQRADAIRPLWLKKHGGVYLDLDYQLQRPLDELFTADLDADAYLVKSGNVSQTLTNSFMASKPNAAVWDAYIAEMGKPAGMWSKLGKHLEVMNTTGPYAMNRAIQKSGAPYKLLPTDLINPCA